MVSDTTCFSSAAKLVVHQEGRSSVPFRDGHVEFDGQRYEICVQVHTIGGYSAHADQKGSVSFVTKMTHWPSWGRVVHREPAAKQQFFSGSAAAL